MGVGLGVLKEVIAEEVDAGVGPKGKHTRAGSRCATAARPGRSHSAAAAPRSPRVRTADGQSEAKLATYEHFADRDPLARVVLERMLAGVTVSTHAGTGQRAGRRHGAFHVEELCVADVRGAPL